VNKRRKGDSHLAVRKRWPSSDTFNKVDVLNIELIIIIIIIIIDHEGPKGE